MARASRAEQKRVSASMRQRFTIEWNQRGKNSIYPCATEDDYMRCMPIVPADAKDTGTVAVACGKGRRQRAWHGEVCGRLREDQDGRIGGWRPTD
jgi:hypothetical protein